MSEISNTHTPTADSPMPVPPPMTPTDSSDVNSSEPTLRNLRPVFDALTVREHFTDLTVRFCDEEIACHKTTLAQSSPYFMARLIKGTLQEPNVLTLTDDNPIALRTIIDFCYVQDADERKSYIEATSQSDGLTEVVQAIIVADKYECTGILKFLSSRLFNLIQAVAKCDDNDLDAKELFRAANASYSVDVPALFSAQRSFAALIVSRLSLLLELPTRPVLLALVKTRPELAERLVGAMDCTSLNIIRHKFVCPHCNVTIMAFSPQCPDRADAFCMSCGNRYSQAPMPPSSSKRRRAAET